MALALIGFAYKYSSMAVEFSEGLPDVSRTFGVVSGAYGMAGLLGGIIAGSLKMIVQHIEALETELEKFVESDGDPKLAAQTLADFLRKMRKAG